MTARLVLVSAALAASCAGRVPSGGVEQLESDEEAARAAPCAGRCSLGPAAVVFRPPGAPAARVGVEVARTGRQIQRGLMHREHLPAGAGMLFLFAREEVQRFWMKDTLIPLDIIFVSSAMRVVGVVENAAPRTLVSRRVAAPSQFVVEVNAGWARAHRVAAGVPVEFVGVPPLQAGEGEIEYDDED